MHIVMKLSKMCNLRCTYCYEYDELSNKERMPLDGIEYFFKSLYSYASSRDKSFPIHLVFHGGEALLLPHEYLRKVCSLAAKYLKNNGINYDISVQSNLFKLSKKTLELLEELDIHLGISLDVFGDQRVDIVGRVSQDKVLDNLQHLLDSDVKFGAISVLHALNVDKAVKTFEFYQELGIRYRILPIHSNHETPPERMKHLLLSHHQTVEALQKVAKARFNCSSPIEVFPLDDYFQAAVRYLIDCEIGIYDPFDFEWALIVNTNGDVYPHGDAYVPIGLMGNLFHQPLSEILVSQAHTNATKVRMQRAETCRRCKFDRKCTQLSIAEAIPSERFYDEAGALQCLIDKPMIQFMVDEIQRSPDAQALLNLYQHQQQSIPQLLPL
ncbi:radical SAM protein [Plectonema cf. radiosum LEGE 06105]|uniref:Radical SAM protein n=1 Tax=Plectonema cf. radiosum LEGE 06105 TaxID=945769 RepID=A0A8J7FCT5_9CYAN|nr:radical SAM protein [Plectonema radiosum]MBE9211901.1 radical SAM protein [Plectonema cf. radiosum LEGE 06105]